MRCLRMRRAGRCLVVAVVLIATGCVAVPPTSQVASPSRTSSPMPSCASIAPTHRPGASLAFDAGHQQTVLFGGLASTSKTLDETWLFDGSCWQQAHPTTSPTPRFSAGMAYDPLAGRTLLIGGRSQQPAGPDYYPQDAWTWDGTAWMQLTAAPKLNFPIASFDQARQLVVVFGWGVGGLPETWTWDGAAWVNKAPPKSPSVVAQSAMCFDQSTRKMLLYGGWSRSVAGGVSDETWLWDGSSWNRAQPVHVPGPRSDLALLCGSGTVLFGGLTNQQGTRANDTWVWDGSDWHTVLSTHTPEDCCGATVYDGKRPVFFETGRDGIPMWSWTGSDWAQ
jgi:hypothetical protein